MNSGPFSICPVWVLTFKVLAAAGYGDFLAVIVVVHLQCFILKLWHNLYLQRSPVTCICNWKSTCIYVSLNSCLWLSFACFLSFTEIELLWLIFLLKYVFESYSCSWRWNFLFLFPFLFLWKRSQHYGARILHKFLGLYAYHLNHHFVGSAQWNFSMIPQWLHQLIF